MTAGWVFEGVDVDPGLVGDAGGVEDRRIESAPVVRVGRDLQFGDLKPDFVVTVEVSDQYPDWFVNFEFDGPVTAFFRFVVGEPDSGESDEVGREIVEGVFSVGEDSFSFLDGIWFGPGGEDSEWRGGRG